MPNISFYITSALRCREDAWSAGVGSDVRVGDLAHVELQRKPESAYTLAI